MSPEHVEVHVRHGLAGIRSVVHNHAKTALPDALLTRDCPRGSGDLAKRIIVLLCCVGKAHDVTAGYHKHMHGGLGMDVAKGHHIVVLVHDVGRDLPRHYLAEQAIIHASV